MSWEVQGSRLISEALGELRPIEVLYEYEGPQIYVTEHLGRPLLVYVSDIDEESELYRLLVVSTSQTILSSLKTGHFSIADALRQPWLHAVDKAFSGEIISIWFLPNGLDAVPVDFKPVEGTLLSPDLEVQRVINRPRENNRPGLTVAAVEFIESYTAEMQINRHTLHMQNVTVIAAISADLDEYREGRPHAQRNQFEVITRH
ncbi:hypothetical protein [Burkholderia gladioli]|uniref:hypothetical protein n=1 Tax=Burkholderia gladioli TaxID=28095 RepID=UPI0038B383E7